jgi:site-specific DNA-cytosine methylase
VTYRPLPIPDPAGPLWAGSLCTGYGGLGLAVTAVLDAGLAWYAEPDPHAAGVLTACWPGTPNLGDITAVDWCTVPPVDLITAGWPCQDISLAGAGRRHHGRNPQWPVDAHRRLPAAAATPLRLPGERRRPAHPRPRPRPGRPCRNRV